MSDEPGKIEAGAGDSGTAATTKVASNGSMETEAVGETKAIGQEKAIQAGEAPRHSRWNRRVALIGGVAALIGAAIVLPPLVNVGRYQHQIAALMSRSLGRPVRISGVELRLLPRPGFVLHDLTVGEDPAFGAEPILSARTVTASIRLLSLWRGRLEVDRVSVDEASLNLVRSAQGRWNLDTLLMGAQPALNGGSGTGSGGLAHRASTHFPYLEATDSQVNLKNGVEKSPYSLVHTDLSLWQDDPGQWRVRLKGQPVRTDMEIVAADTGELRVEASLRSAAQLREMPLQLQMEWRDAQLGQLSRLLFGSDAGWRGDLTADIDMRGTPDNAQTRARLRATGVRRQEFAPETPLDFDANCNFRYQHSLNALHDVGCDTAIGGGHLNLKAELPGGAGSPKAVLEVSQLPLQAGLDLLRTVRSGFAPGISMKGTANGSLTYEEAAAASPTSGQTKTQHHPLLPRAGQRGGTIEKAALPADLTGTLAIDGVQLKGGGLKDPLTLPHMTLTPTYLVDPAGAAQGSGAGKVGLGTRFTVVLAPAAPASASTPVTSAAKAPPAEAGAAPAVASGPSAASNLPSASAPPAAQALTLRLGLGARGYSAAISGSAAIARIRDLAYAFGLPQLDAVGGFSDGVAVVDLGARGPWLDSGGGSEVDSPANSPADSAAAPAQSAQSGSSGSLARLQNGLVPVANPGRSPMTANAASNATNSLTSSPTKSPMTSLAAWPGPESISGSVTIRRALWKAAYLACPVHLTQAAMTISPVQISFTSGFVYGGIEDAVKDSNKIAPKNSVPNTVEGSVIINEPLRCKSQTSESSPAEAKGGGCDPEVQVRLGSLDAAVVEAVLLGAPQQKGIFAPLIDRVRSSGQPKWPDAAVSIQADSLVLGPTTLQKPVMVMRFKPAEVDIESWQADLLGGTAKGTGNFAWNADKPQYSFDGSFDRLNAAAVGELLNAQWTGGPVSGNGSVQLSGLNPKDLAASAAGDLHFDWLHGVLLAGGTAADGTQSQQTKFDDWNGTVKVQNGKVELGDNTLLSGKRNSKMSGTIAFGGPVKVAIEPAENKLEAHTVKPAVRSPVKATGQPTPKAAVK